MASRDFERFDVIIQCHCGRNLVFQIMDKPWRPRWRCSVCGSRDATVQIWPIWSRALKGDPRELFDPIDPTDAAAVAAREDLKRRFGIE